MTVTGNPRAVREWSRRLDRACEVRRVDGVDSLAREPSRERLRLRSADLVETGIV